MYLNSRSKSKQMYSELFHLVFRAELNPIYLEELIEYKTYLFSNSYFSIFIIVFLGLMLLVKEITNNV